MPVLSVLLEDPGNLCLAFVEADERAGSALVDERSQRYCDVVCMICARHANPGAVNAQAMILERGGCGDP